MRQRLEVPGQPTARLAHALGHRVDLAAMSAEERDDLVRFAQFALAQHDCVRLIYARSRHGLGRRSEISNSARVRDAEVERFESVEAEEVAKTGRRTRDKCRTDVDKGARQPCQRDSNGRNQHVVNSATDAPSTPMPLVFGINTQFSQEAVIEDGDFAAGIHGDRDRQAFTPNG